MKRHIKSIFPGLFKLWILFFTGLLCYQTSLGAKLYSAESAMEMQSHIKKIKKGKDGRYIKRNYRETYYGIKEFALRVAPGSLELQQEEFDKQSMAFRAIEKLWMISQPEDKERKAIKRGLLRWNWLEGDPVLNNPRPVDWYMVYMECIYGKKN